MDVIELWNGDTKALIDPRGAWLTNLSDDYGDILYPKRQLTASDDSAKVRGGCHVCLPNFGPGGDSDLAQHGFGRTSLWEIVEQSESGATLKLSGGAAGYENLESTLSYALQDDSVRISLTCENKGSAQLRVAPGFHPYFALNRGEGQVILSGQKYDNQDLADTEFFDDKTEMTLELQRRTFTLASENLPTWAFWTDQLGDYVCCEPTVGGYTFLSEKPADLELLDGGQAKSYTMTIAW